MNRGGEEQLQCRGGGDEQDGGGGGGGGGGGVRMGRGTGDSGANRKHTPHLKIPHWRGIMLIPHLLLTGKGSRAGTK